MTAENTAEQINSNQRSIKSKFMIEDFWNATRSLRFYDEITETRAWKIYLLFDLGQNHPVGLIQKSQRPIDTVQNAWT